MDLICKEKIRILCIEDNPIDVRILERSLEKAGVDHQLDEASCLEADWKNSEILSLTWFFQTFGSPGPPGLRWSKA